MSLDPSPLAGRLWSSQFRGSVCPPPPRVLLRHPYPLPPPCSVHSQNTKPRKTSAGSPSAPCRPFFWWGFTSLERDGMSLVQFSDRHGEGGGLEHGALLAGPLYGGRAEDGADGLIEDGLQATLGESRTLQVLDGALCKKKEEKFIRPR